MSVRFERPPVSEVIAAVQRYCAWRAGLMERNQFCPALVYPATWLNEQRWSDEFDEAPKIAAPIARALEVLEQETQARMAHARADAAWIEVMHARRARSMPLGGFDDTRAGQVLAVIGGWSALDGCRTAAQVHALRLEFLAAYVREAEPSGNVVTMRRSA